MLGKRVTVNIKEGRYVRHCEKPRFNGRVGVVTRENEFGRGRNGGLWYVALESTKRAKPRTESFYGDDLVVEE